MEKEEQSLKLVLKQPWVWSVSYSTFLSLVNEGAPIAREARERGREEKAEWGRDRERYRETERVGRGATNRVPVRSWRTQSPRRRATLYDVIHSHWCHAVLSSSGILSYNGRQCSTRKFIEPPDRPMRRDGSRRHWRRLVKNIWGKCGNNWWLPASIIGCTCQDYLPPKSTPID